MNQNTIKVDVCVIGAGASGLAVAEMAVQIGMDVALIEKERLGGAFLNSVCLPKTGLFEAAKVANTSRHADRFGFEYNEHAVDIRAVKKGIEESIRRIEPHYSAGRFEALGVRIYEGEARFIDDHHIQLKEDVINAKYIVIATGAVPDIPDIDGIKSDKVLTPYNIHKLHETPRHLIVLGGQGVALELAQSYRRLGSRVTLITENTIMPDTDFEIAGMINEALSGEGIKINENSRVSSVKHKLDRLVDDGVQYNDDNVTVVFETQNREVREVGGSHLLVCADESPEITCLDLMNAGVDVEGKSIKTSQDLRTSQKHIFVVGNAGLGPGYMHVSAYEAHIVLKNMLLRKRLEVDYSQMPRVVFTDPEFAAVGMTDEQARTKYGRKINVSVSKLRDNDRAVVMKQEAGMIKVITHKNGQILGCSILAAQAGELISIWVLALSQNLKIRDMPSVLAAYPTLSDVSQRAGGMSLKSSLSGFWTRLLIRLLQKFPG